MPTRTTDDETQSMTSLHGLIGIYATSAKNLTNQETMGQLKLQLTEEGLASPSPVSDCSSTKYSFGLKANLYTFVLTSLKVTTFC